MWEYWIVKDNYKRKEKRKVKFLSRRNTQAVTVNDQAWVLTTMSSNFHMNVNRKLADGLSTFNLSAHQSGAVKVEP